ncbi:cation:proton antiporter [Anaplasma phagocytophilum str. MRK]|uniref:proton-conducting transporter transmembrane domain-containing protein n=1 Tax=Anaplasma phagocytophilum TaxID=948 RepID=UPI0005339856|nr:proton-conducting transporter membrane subunit [Anaplasma phagocytophilum]KDB56645.1 cation:proton antiporter [Anaplasma phagocytophilum str. MRK]
MQVYRVQGLDVTFSMGSLYNFTFSNIFQALGGENVFSLDKVSAIPLIMSFLASMFCIVCRCRVGFKELLCSLLYCISSIAVLLFSNLTLVTIGFEIMALAAVCIVAFGAYKGRDFAFLHYACLHFISGFLLLVGASQHAHLGVLEGIPRWFFMLGLIINTAAFPAASWLVRAYPVSSSFGMLVLSLFTTKVALYVLLKFFSGESIILYFGIFTSIYAAIFAFLEQNVRRLMAYMFVGQAGLLMMAIGCPGIPSDLIIVQLSFSVLYQLLLGMFADSVVKRSGHVDINRMAGCFKLASMEAMGCIVALLNLGGFPWTAGFVTKGLMLHMNLQSFDYMLLKYMQPMLGWLLFASNGMKLFWLACLKPCSTTPEYAPSPFSSKLSIIMLSLIITVSGVLYGEGLLFSEHKFVYTFGAVATKLIWLGGVVLFFILFRRQFLGRYESAIGDSWVYRQFFIMAEKFAHAASRMREVLGGLFAGGAFSIETSGSTVLSARSPSGVVSSTLLLVMLSICIIVLVWAYV